MLLWLEYNLLAGDCCPMDTASLSDNVLKALFQNDGRISIIN
jgi:hypothetical protein